MQSTGTVCKGVNQMVHTFRITKEQYFSGTSCRLQGLQQEVVSNNLLVVLTIVVLTICCF